MSARASSAFAPSAPARPLFMRTARLAPFSSSPFLTLSSRSYDDETVALLQSIRLARSLGLGIDDILSVHATLRDGGRAQPTLVASLEKILERTVGEIGELEKRKGKIEAILTHVRAAPPSEDQKVKERVRSAWRRAEDARRGTTKRGP